MFSACYGSGNKRQEIIEKKLCCPKFEYDGNCYDKCPSRMRATNGNKICRTFTCSYYYNYNQDGCIDTNNIPEGYYLNDTILKTIDKCHKTCTTCSGGPTETKAYCLTCNNTTNPYLFFDNCLESFDNGSYIDSSGILRCRCITDKCSDCTEESLDNGLCVKCNEGYY